MAKVSEINNQSIPFERCNPVCSDIDSVASSQCHPLLLQTFKPVRTTGDGNCLFSAISITINGNESITHVLRVLWAYGLYKHKQVILEAFRHAYPNRDPIQYIGTWGSDHHILALSFLLNRPILQYNTFYHTHNGAQSLTLLNIHTTRDFTTAFAMYHPDVRTHIVYFTQEHYNLIVSGNVLDLPYTPLALSNFGNVHWVAMQLRSNDVVAEIPLPKTKLF